MPCFQTPFVALVHSESSGPGGKKGLNLPVHQVKPADVPRHFSDRLKKIRSCLENNPVSGYSF